MDLNQVYRLKQPVVLHPFGDQVYVIPIREKLADMTMILGLNQTAARIWQSLDSGLTPCRVIRDLSREYDTPAIEIRYEVVRFLTEIQDFFEDDTQPCRIPD
jgi:non-ribosomal peptide synthetase component F